VFKKTLSFLFIFDLDLRSDMRKLIFLSLVFSLLSGSVLAQKTKPWTELTKKDCEKILNDSAWGQTQTEADTSEMMYSPTVTPTAPATRNPNISSGSTSTRNQQGASNTVQSIKYRIRFLSSKPIREAFASMIVQLQPQVNREAVVPQMQSFVDRDFGEFIVIAVDVEATDRRFSGPVEQALASSTGEILKNNTYLERKDGKRLFLMDYRPPGKDGLGAKFVFARTVDGDPFLTPESESVRFVSEVNSKIKMNMKFKLSEMIYNGKLEY
jgi:hypothetical protein